MDIRRITAQQALPIRHQVLWPNKSLEYCSVKGDDTAWHFGVFFDDVCDSLTEPSAGEQLISVASIYFNEGEFSQPAQLRKFATLESHQSKGVGSYLLGHILQQLKEHKPKDQQILSVWCDARESAVGFYQRFGMATSGERFYKGGSEGDRHAVAYFKMSVQLADVQSV